MLTSLKQNHIELDKYYTKPEIATTCFKLLNNYLNESNINISEYIFLEPSAGNGSFLNSLNEYKFVAFDLAPEDFRIIKKDYLLDDLQLYKNLQYKENERFGSNDIRSHLVL
jgi:hypothetical protein